MRTGSQVCSDFNDPAVPQNNISMKQRSGAFRRDQSDIFDDYAPISNALHLSGESNIENDQPSEYSDKQSIAQERPCPIQMPVAT
jgi:hypothetical protein